MPRRLPLVYAQNGEALRPEQGYPLRLVVRLGRQCQHQMAAPYQLDDRPWYSREETRIYRFDAGRHLARLHLADRPKSSSLPCPEKPLNGPGLYESALAWSGNGKVTQVDVSADGGVNWQRGQLHDPVLSKALTKFTLPWCWDASQRCWNPPWWTRPVTCSRPLRNCEKSAVELVYHNNSIQTWQVKPDGSVLMSAS